MQQKRIYWLDERNIFCDVSKRLFHDSSKNIHARPHLLYRLQNIFDAEK